MVVFVTLHNDWPRRLPATRQRMFTPTITAKKAKSFKNLKDLAQRVGEIFSRCRVRAAQFRGLWPCPDRVPLAWQAYQVLPAAPSAIAHG